MAAHDLYLSTSSGDEPLGVAADPAAEQLREALAHAAHLLPAQGPISVFIHHNTLHAFEHLPFDEAVQEAARQLDAEPWLAESDYRRELATGRIELADLERALDEEPGEAPAPRLPGDLDRRTLRLALLRFGVETPTGSALAWHLHETDALSALRADLPAELRARQLPPDASEAASVHALWDACLMRARLDRAAAAGPLRLPRHRELLLQLTGEDTDELVHPALFRLCAAFLDQGVAAWPMPGRGRGLYAAACELWASALGPQPEWLAELRRCAREERALPPVEAALRSLRALGVQPFEVRDYVTDALLAIRGWAGMIHQMEQRPDRVPVFSPPARLVDLLATRLLLDRQAVAWAARQTLDLQQPLDTLRYTLHHRLHQPTPPDPREPAFFLFQIAQLTGISAAALRVADDEAIVALLDEARRFDHLHRRRLLHHAYEHHLHGHILDALASHAAMAPTPAPPVAFQAVFCIDEREESLRRHLEELEPACQTFGAAGFFGVAMAFQGARDARPRPLCPIVIRPQHEVHEIVEDHLHGAEHLRHDARRSLGRLSHAAGSSSRTAMSGLLTALLGTLMAVPLVFRVLFPRLTGKLRGQLRHLTDPPGHTSLTIDRGDAAPLPGGLQPGFTAAEQAAIVRRLLEDTGLRRHLADLVVIVGHGSASINNPHQSAYDCGACGGGQGGPNARAFAAMANSAEVRALLAADGLNIPETTYFLPAQHNTTTDAITFYDTHLVPGSHSALLQRAQHALDQARAHNAHERCRRFESAPGWLPPRLALAHVEARAQDLAQPRPELGHATNACLLVGRRDATRGLFMDRRAFLVSYDPTQDTPDTATLTRLLDAVLPVCAGINLEYFFSRVDPLRYGAGTKLPHNVTGLVGVMDGHASDLRTGLPWQMVEIHEPVRLLTLIEATPDALLTLLQRPSPLRTLARHGWIKLVALDPDSHTLHTFEVDHFKPWTPSPAPLARAHSSGAWYRGRRHHLPFARITPE